MKNVEFMGVLVMRTYLLSGLHYNAENAFLTQQLAQIFMLVRLVDLRAAEV